MPRVEGDYQKNDPVERDKIRFVIGYLLISLLYWPFCQGAVDAGVVAVLGENGAMPAVLSYAIALGFAMTPFTAPIAAILGAVYGWGLHWLLAVALVTPPYGFMIALLLRIRRANRTASN